MKVNGKCRLLMGVYYMVICIIFSYAAYYLGARGFSSWEIGVIYSGSCVAGGILQAAAGRLADRDPRWYWKKQVTLCSLLALIVSLLRLFVHGSVWEGASYGLLIVLVLIMLPMVNTACFYYNDRGVDVDYGIARGIGSVGYAAASFALGRLTAAKGPDSLLACCAAMFALLLVSGIIMPEAGALVNAPEDAGASEEKGSGRAFAAEYPVFILMAAGIALALTFNNMLATYMINIMEEAGGGPDSMGVALAIAGAVELPVLFLYTRIKGKTGMTSATLIAAGCLFFAVRGGLLIAASGVMLIYFVQLLQSVSYGLVTAAKADYANETVDPAYETTGQAVMSMTESFGMVAGSLIGGILLSGGGTGRMLIAGTAMAAAGTIVAFIAARAGGKRG